MSDWIVYHNPRCMKSRGVLDLLDERGVEPRIVQYLKTPLTVAELRALLKKLALRPRDIVRAKEPVFHELHLDLNDDAAVLDAIAKHPVLLERPIVVRGDRAVVGRPSNRALELL